jgi:5-carboxymethyl-2-hydroxymuconate isomerase
MPHCIIEFSNSLRSQFEVESLMSKVTQGSLNSGLFDVKDVKTRALGFDYCQSAASSENADFIHVNVKLLAGRNMLQRKLLSKSVLDAILTLNLHNVSVTVEINDIDTECYAKQVFI